MRHFIPIFVIVVLLGSGIAGAQEREYVPMLVEGQKWVSRLDFVQGGGIGAYTIEIKGDTTVEGRTYKKVYRYAESHAPEMLVPFYLSEYHPAACLREEAGVVYRLCDKIKSDVEDGDGDYYFDYDHIPGWGYSLPSRFYPKVVNSTDEHYEVVLYDFNDINGTYLDTRLNRCDDIVIDGTARRTQSTKSAFNENWVIIEGLGSVTVCDGDLISPVDHRYFRSSGWLSTLLFVMAPDGRMIFNHKWDLYDPELNEELGLDEYPDFYTEYCAYHNMNRFDFNGDGITDVDEVNVAVNSILNEKAPDMRADMNVDHVVDVDDVDALINYILSQQ